MLIAGSPTSQWIHSWLYFALFVQAERARVVRATHARHPRVPQPPSQLCITSHSRDYHQIFIIAIKFRSVGMQFLRSLPSTRTLNISSPTHLSSSKTSSKPKLFDRALKSPYFIFIFIFIFLAYFTGSIMQAQCIHDAHYRGSKSCPGISCEMHWSGSYLCRSPVLFISRNFLLRSKVSMTSFNSSLSSLYTRCDDCFNAFSFMTVNCRNNKGMPYWGQSAQSICSRNLQSAWIDIGGCEIRGCKDSSDIINGT